MTDSPAGREPFPKRTPARVVGPAAVIAALVLLVAAQLAQQRYVDHDVFHQMALARETLRLGSVPDSDLFSYTPTVHPSVHHEWATGMVLHGVMEASGVAGLGVLRMALTMAVLGLAVWCARRRGASWSIIAALTAIGTLLIGAGYSPVRAQMFTLVFLAAQLLMMDMDRQGRRGWCGIWLLMYVVWLNFHAGFVVGVGLLAVHWAEQVVRTRRAQWHLVITVLATLPLLMLNPYGTAYFGYLWDAITMPRAGITEWRPLWDDPVEFGVVAFTVIIIGYAAARRGWANMPGLPVVGLAAFEAFLHRRHMSILGVVFLCYVPGFLVGTPLTSVLQRVWGRHARAIAAVCAVVALRAAAAMPGAPWDVEFAVRPSPDHQAVVLPVGATQYLESIGFAGRLMTPFDGSAYVMWRLGPRVKLSMDSRYEAAYAPGVFEEISNAYNAGPRWQETLERYPPDLILVPRGRPLAAALEQETGWRAVYRDDAFMLFAPGGARLVALDWSGKPIVSRLH